MNLKNNQVDAYLMIIQALLPKDQDIRSIRIEGKSIIQYACMTGNINLINLLISSSKTDINTIDEEGKSILYNACESGNADIVRYLLSIKDINVNSFSYSNSPLCIAVEKGYEDIVKQLLAMPNININYQYTEKFYNDISTIKKTILHIAIENNRESIVELLLENPNIDVNSLHITEINLHNNLNETKKKTPLHIAVKNNNANIVRALLAKPNINVNILKEYSLKKYCYYNNSFKTEKENKSKSQTALYIAVSNNNADIVKLLLTKQNIDVNESYCVVNTKKITESYRRGAKIEEEESEKISPLNKAIIQRNLNIVKFLLTVPSIDVNSTYDKQSKTYYYRFEGYSDTKDWFTEGKSEEYFHQAPLYLAYDTELIKYLLTNQRINVNQISTIFTKKQTYRETYINDSFSNTELIDEYYREEKITSLHKEIKSMHIDGVKLLLAHDNININIPYELKHCYGKSKPYEIKETPIELVNCGLYFLYSDIGDKIRALLNKKKEISEPTFTNP